MMTPAQGEALPASGDAGLEARLAGVIIAAREVAITAEELLRELARAEQQRAAGMGAGDVAPPLLRVTGELLGRVREVLRAL